jgi:hypothetical protein
LNDDPSMYSEKKRSLAAALAGAMPAIKAPARSARVETTATRRRGAERRGTAGSTEVLRGHGEKVPGCPACGGT